MPSPPRAALPVTVIAALLFVGLCALGVWQVERLAWKRDLIARVDARIHALPVPAPDRATQADEYRRITVYGRFIHDRATLVRASTVRGPGFWVLTPLRTANNRVLLVNRGYVPPQSRTAYAKPQGIVRITGLLRLTEPGGGFLRANDPTVDRWYSRDIAAIGAARSLAPITTDYFIDAQAGSQTETLPIAGLTVIRFPNNHLVYAVTWFILAVMVVGAYIFVMRQHAKDHHL